MYTRIIILDLWYRIRLANNDNRILVVEVCDKAMAECQVAEALSTLCRMLDTFLQAACTSAPLSTMSSKFLGIIIGVGLHIAETPCGLGHEYCACHGTEEKYISRIKNKTCLGFTAIPYMSVISINCFLTFSIEHKCLQTLYYKRPLMTRRAI